jgi:hypothetical protein
MAIVAVAAITVKDRRRSVFTGRCSPTGLVRTGGAAGILASRNAQQARMNTFAQPSQGRQKKYGNVMNKIR